MNRPHTTVVLAMSADGKIADRSRTAAHIGSYNDKLHLERQIARSDAVLLGAGTLRADQASLPITTPALLGDRQQQGKPPQPINIVCSPSGNLDPDWKFFHQGIPRWLLTSPQGAQRWQQQPQFERVLLGAATPSAERLVFDWPVVFEQLAQFNLDRIAVLGGAELIASLLAVNLIDELWITLCPVILGGADAATPVAGPGFFVREAPKLDLCEVIDLEGELFLNYRVKR